MKKLSILLVTSLLIGSFCACTSTSVETSIESTPIVATAAPEQAVGPYSLEGMTADEIFDLCVAFAEVNNGDTVADFANRFTVEPTSVEYNFYQFTTDGTNEYNCITGVYPGIATNPDDTFLVQATSYVQVEMKIIDPEIARDLYDRAYQYSLDYGTATYDDRNEEGYWNCLAGGCFQELTVNGNVCDLLLQIPVTGRPEN